MEDVEMFGSLENNDEILEIENEEIEQNMENPTGDGEQMNNKNTRNKENIENHENHEVDKNIGNDSDSDSSEVNEGIEDVMNGQLFPASRITKLAKLSPGVRIMTKDAVHEINKATVEFVKILTSMGASRCQGGLVRPDHLLAAMIEEGNKYAFVTEDSAVEPFLLGKQNEISASTTAADSQSTSTPALTPTLDFALASAPTPALQTRHLPTFSKPKSTRKKTVVPANTLNNYFGI